MITATVKYCQRPHLCMLFSKCTLCFDSPPPDRRVKKQDLSSNFRHWQKITENGEQEAALRLPDLMQTVKKKKKKDIFFPQNLAIYLCVMHSFMQCSLKWTSFSAQFKGSSKYSHFPHSDTIHSHSSLQYLQLCKKKDQYVCVWKSWFCFLKTLRKFVATDHMLKFVWNNKTNPYVIQITLLMRSVLYVEKK